jgi:hypothetical protein
MHIDDIFSFFSFHGDTLFISKCHSKCAQHILLYHFTIYKILVQKEYKTVTLRSISYHYNPHCSHKPSTIHSAQSAARNTPQFLSRIAIAGIVIVRSDPNIHAAVLYQLNAPCLRWKDKPAAPATIVTSREHQCLLYIQLLVHFYMAASAESTVGK